MANRLKKKILPPDPEQLTEDKEVEVTVTEVVKDERTTKIAGAVSLLFAIFLFIAFSSYLFIARIRKLPPPHFEFKDKKWWLVKDGNSLLA